MSRDDAAAIIWSRGSGAKFCDILISILLVSMCVENVLVGGRNLNKFKSGDVNDKCYNTVSLSRAEGCQDQYQQGSERNIKKC